MPFGRRSVALSRGEAAVGHREAAFVCEKAVFASRRRISSMSARSSRSRPSRSSELVSPKRSRTQPVRAVAEAVRRELERLQRPAGEFDASRYFRGEYALQFFNVGTPRVRALARRTVTEHPEWTIVDALAFAELLIADPVLEVKGVAVEVVARYRRSFAPAHLAMWKRWLAANHASNWATTDSICGLLIGPLLVAHPELAGSLRSWSASRNLWVRRASAVGLLPGIRRRLHIDQGFATAVILHPDEHDLMHKAVGWLLRELGKVDPGRLERHLLEHGPAIPRTTVRYAIERFPAARRQQLLAATRGR